MSQVTASDATASTKESGEVQAVSFTADWKREELRYLLSSFEDVEVQRDSWLTDAINKEKRP